MVKRVVQNTEGIASRERWDFWKETALSPVDAKAFGDPAAFTANRTLSQGTQWTLIETTSKPMWMNRPRRRIARDGIDHACLVIALEGSGVIDQFSRPQDVLRPGDLILYDLGRPYTAASAEPYRELRFYIPREKFAQRIGRIETLSGLQLKGRSGLVNLFTTYCQGFASSLPSLDLGEAEAGMDGLLHLLSTLVRSSLSVHKGEGREAPSRDTLLALALRYIEVLLNDPSLDVATLARAIGVSRTRLYDAFAPLGGVASAIRNARLERARSCLAGFEAQYRTTEAIALACGFLEYSTFSKAFQRRFGISPRDMRAKDAHSAVRLSKGASAEAGTAHACSVSKRP